MLLLLLKVENDSVTELYKNSVSKLWDPKNLDNNYKDSGFDLYCPNNIVFFKDCTRLVDLGVKAAAYQIEEDWNSFSRQNFDRLSTISTLENLTFTAVKPVAFELHCRSSIYKSCFRLANNVGIIDSGYRGNLMAAVDYTNNRQLVKKNTEDSYITANGDMKRGDRYFQICMGNLEPFGVILVDSLEDTERGQGGFGSTGK
tara:strand:+ start:195 stop:797 length:603 start_codon:yes stop_codon:yes gene_type:complete